MRNVHSLKRIICEREKDNLLYNIRYKYCASG